MDAIFAKNVQEINWNLHYFLPLNFCTIW